MLEGVKSPYPIVVTWEGDKRFRGGLPNGPSILTDGDRRAGPSPVDSLLVAIGSCSGIDVVEFLQKRRTPAASLSVELEFSRAPTPPRRLTEVIAHFRVATVAERHHVERAVQLAFHKYCSVVNSLAPDTALSWTLEIISPDPAEVDV
jgi:putative redox protein